MGQRNKEVTPCSSSATKAAAWWQQVGTDSAPGLFVLVALALHHVLGTSSPGMPIPCSAPPASPAVPPAPTTPAPGGLPRVSAPLLLPQHVGDMEITPKRNHQDGRDGTAKPRGYCGGLEIQVPAGQDTAPLQPPEPCPAALSLQPAICSTEQGKALQGLSAAH